jgi:hypothetical protein
MSARDSCTTQNINRRYMVFRRKIKFSSLVHDVDRPDVGGIKTKMQAICEQANAELAGIVPFFRIRADDNIMSSVTIRGTSDPQNEWTNGIFQNGKYFIFAIQPMNGKRYYSPDDEKVTVTLDSVSSECKGKFRKYTATPDKCIAKVKTWLVAQIEERTK